MYENHRVKKYLLTICLLSIAAITSPMQEARAQSGTLLTNGHGVGSTNQFMADVDGNGYKDAVVFFRDSGDWYVSRSMQGPHSAFQPYTRFISGHGRGSHNQMMADVNGDHLEDAVIYFGDTGEWYVALSDGSRFKPYTRWTAGHGVGSSAQFLSDVDGNGLADAVVYFARRGEWYVALSSNWNFGSYRLWTSGHGIGSHRQFLGDVNGDGRADAAVFFADSGDWFLSLSSGSSFKPYSRWIQGHGIGTHNQLLVDANNDGMADAVVYFNDSGDWYAAKSLGNTFAFSRNIGRFGAGSWRQFIVPDSYTIPGGRPQVNIITYYGSNGSWWGYAGNLPTGPLP